MPRQNKTDNNKSQKNHSKSHSARTNHKTHRNTTEHNENSLNSSKYHVNVKTSYKTQRKPQNAPSKKITKHNNIDIEKVGTGSQQGSQQPFHQSVRKTSFFFCFFFVCECPCLTSFITLPAITY